MVGMALGEETPHFTRPFTPGACHLALGGPTISFGGMMSPSPNMTSPFLGFYFVFFVFWHIFRGKLRGRPHLFHVVNKLCGQIVLG
jgi:hypothetical protein